VPLNKIMTKLKTGNNFEVCGTINTGNVIIILNFIGYRRLMAVSNKVKYYSY